MAHERPIDTCECFQMTAGAGPFFPAAAIVNGGAGTGTNTLSRNHGAREVVIYGYTITTVGTNLQFSMPTTDPATANGTPGAVTGLLFSAAALGTVTFPRPVRLRAVGAVAGTPDANFSVSDAGATAVATIYYKRIV